MCDSSRNFGTCRSGGKACIDDQTNNKPESNPGAEVFPIDQIFDGFEFFEIQIFRHDISSCQDSLNVLVLSYTKL